MKSVHQICTFHVEDLFLGIDVQEVQEVIRYQRMTTVPMAPSMVSGLINLRGQIVTAMDLRIQLGLPGLDLQEARPMNVVVRNELGTTSLLVDEIGDVIEIETDAMEVPPDTLEPALRALTRGIYKLPAQLLLLLNTEQLVCAGSSTKPKAA